MTESAYIHIPFCKSKCRYCSFVSYTKSELKGEYLTSLHKEIKLNYKGEKLNTLYFGGGTPSVLNAEEFKNLINLFNTDETTEITAELNPDDLNYEYLGNLHKTGINRISIGCQTFNDEILKLINRRHTAIQAINAVKAAQDNGFKNISLDFIYGLPNQTSEMFLSDLEKAAELKIRHISLYGLSVEKGCYFAANPPENIADDDMQADMYLNAVNLLQKSGFNHYEFSNFAVEGFESRHNLNYWNNEEYYGFGTAAHSYVKGIRHSNTVNLEEYIKNPYKPHEEHNVTQKERLEEEIFLGFRKMSGINVNLINSKFAINFEKKYGKILEKYTHAGYMIKNGQNYALNAKGVLISNTILADFLE